MFFFSYQKLSQRLSVIATVTEAGDSINPIYKRLKSATERLRDRSAYTIDQTNQTSAWRDS